MPNNYLPVLYKHIIQVENKKVGRAQTYHCPPPPPNQKGGGHMPPCVVFVVVVVAVTVLSVF